MSGSSPPATITPPPAACQDRTALCGQDMMNAAAAALHPNNVYSPTISASAAIHPFSGTLTAASVPFEGITTGEEMPGFSVEFITVDDVLVPMRRNIISSPELIGAELILSEGKVWSEPGDNGMSRAAFPFVVTSKFYNGSHNGLATFVYDETRVSSVYFQVTQENDSLKPCRCLGQNGCRLLAADVRRPRGAFRGVSPGGCGAHRTSVPGQSSSRRLAPPR